MHRIFFLQSVLLLLLTLTGCRSFDDDSSLNVANGKVTSSADPTVVLLLMDGHHICTGTYISDHLILTAAHCLTETTTADHVTRQVVSGRSQYNVNAVGQRLIIHPGYHSETDLNVDLGLVVVPSGSSSVWAKVAGRAATVGDPVRMVGYGHSTIKRDTQGKQIEEQGAGEKRSGTNRIGTVTAGILFFDGMLSEAEARYRGKPVGSEVSIGSGDSGGPLFNARGELVGVTSSQDFKMDAWGIIESMNSIFVDLHGVQAREFLANHAGL